MKPMRVGIIGCGNIFANYVRHARLFDVLELAACADLDMDRAASQADEHNLPKACTPTDLLADDSIELVINLTVPTAHEDVSLAAIAASKHVYSEKPMAVNRQGGRRIIAAAEAGGVRIGFAPDTFLGAGMQTSRKLIDDGQIGQPTFAVCHVIFEGHDRWHPNPQFFYQHGAGPVFDMGPYYITGLMQLFGRVRRVTASGTITRPARTLKTGPNAGSEIRIETPDHVSANLEFDCGVHATLIASFAGWHPDLWPFTVFGVEGTLRVQDLNTFDEPNLSVEAGQPQADTA